MKGISIRQIKTGLDYYECRVYIKNGVIGFRGSLRFIEEMLIRLQNYEYNLNWNK